MEDRNPNNNKKIISAISLLVPAVARASVLVLINRATLTTVGKDWCNPCTVPCPDLLLLDAHWVIKNERGWAKWGLLAEQSRPCVHAFLRPLAVCNFARTLQRCKFYIKITFSRRHLSTVAWRLPDSTMAGLVINYSYILK